MAETYGAECDDRTATVAKEIRDTKPFRVLLTCAFFEPGFRAGGPIRSVSQLLDVVSPAIEVTMVTRDRDLGSTAAYPGLSGRWVRRGQARICYVNPRRPRHWWLLAKRLTRIRFDLLYVNSLWAPSSIFPILAARLSLIRARRILVAPRGELAPTARNVKATKKRIFLPFWRPFLSGSRVLWHATNPQEAELIAQTFPGARIETRPNDVSISGEPLVPSAADGPLRLVFISRINPIKNLTTALTALGRMSRPAMFDIYGPIEDVDYWAACQDLIRRLPETVSVNYRGELTPDQVRPTFARYDAFVFPTQGENFGHVIAESLSASCPVLCADRTPWTPVLREGGGEVLADLAPETLAHQLDLLAAAPPERRLRARHAAGEAYRSWRARTDEPNILDRIRMDAASR
ncbi:glycosyltransferase [Micromonospora sp. NPDC051296]|uniref:glycosyltransferase n=1 Tax=Micromonospora sp. NPDC051296 TaxID=3155046 RepID=UPI003413ADE1